MRTGSAATKNTITVTLQTNFPILQGQIITIEGGISTCFNPRANPILTHLSAMLAHVWSLSDVLLFG